MIRDRRTRFDAPWRPSRAVLLSFAVAVALALWPVHAAGAEPHVFVVCAGTFEAPGTTAALEITEPWTSQTALGAVGRAPRVRIAGERLYVVNGAPDHTIQVIDAATHVTLLTIPVGPDTDPRDIAVLDDDTAYVTRYLSPWLLRVDLSTGARLDSLDLGSFADPDGLPDLAMMARDGDHLLVQVQRRDQITTWDVVPPSMLAVVDVVAHALVDVDPITPGIQAITLTGPLPDHDMYVVPGERRLLLSAPGGLLDLRGGIEAIDLDALTSLGLILEEKETIGDLGALLVASATRGFFIGHTDIIASTHLFAFSPADGSVTSGQIYFATNYVRHMAYDAPTDQLFLPDTDAGGVAVLDGLTNDVLTPAPIPTGPRPVDLVVVRDGAVGVGDPIAPLHHVGAVPTPVGRGGRVALPGLRWSASVYDAGGRLVRALDAARGAGSILWDTRDARGLLVTPGVYFVRSERGIVRRVVVR